MASPGHNELKWQNLPEMQPLLYPPYPKDRGMLWFYVEAARRPPPAARRPQWC